ncbi:MAG: hypothetical protein MUP58_00710 [Candidatus Nanohaloarchaeota archaeon QJJ-9]|nr:hypothetical protein [Candidatus Nanohaloarchaeota archaeon QJJ-9]
MKRKGISPLIAAVLLIAFTMAVAAILTAWVTQFTQDTTGAVGNESERVIQCSYAGLSIYDAVNDSGNLTVSVANTGTQDMSNVSITAFMEDGSLTNTYMGALPTGGVQEITLTDLSGTLSSVRATSTDCPGVTDEQTEITQ